jgi:hypothetical protein
MADKKQWRDLTSRQKTAIVVLGAVEVVATTAALVDIARRPRPAIRGPKVLWVATSFVQPIGPFAYVAIGRRRS